MTAKTENKTTKNDNLNRHPNGIGEFSGESHL